MSFFAFSFSIYIKFFTNLLALVNPIGMTPIFISMTHRFSKEKRDKTNLITNISVFFILFFSMLLGKYFLNFFGISVNSFRIAGGILIIMIAIRMISGKLNSDIIKERDKTKCVEKESIAVVPLAIPLIAGPGAISSTIMWASQNYGLGNMIFCSFVIAFFCFFCWFLFKFSPCIIWLIGETGINVVTRIMGLLLLSLGIEICVHGIVSSLSKIV